MNRTVGSKLISHSKICVTGGDSNILYSSIPKVIHAKILGVCCPKKMTTAQNILLTT